MKEHINIDHENGDHKLLQANIEVKELESVFNFQEIKKQITEENLQKERKMFGIALEGNSKPLNNFHRHQFQK